MGEIIKYLFGVVFFSGLLYASIQIQLYQVEQVHRLKERGVETNAAVDDVTLTYRRAYGIPISREGKLNYHFTTGSGERIDAVQNVKLETFQSISPDGKTFLQGTPVRIAYLPNHPKTNLPVSEFGNQAVFDWTPVIVPALCLGGLCLSGIFRLNRWAFSQSNRRLDTDPASLGNDDGPGIYQVMPESPAAVEEPEPARIHRTPAPPPAGVPRAVPKAAGASRPAFGRRV